MASIIPITDFAAPELDPIARLTEHQLLRRDAPEEGMFIAETAVVIRRALDAGCRPVAFFLEEKLLADVGAPLAAEYPETPLYIAPFEVLCQLIGYNLTHGALALMRRPPLPEVAALCRGARRIAVLENVMNPTNVGAILRSAAALNMDAVLLTAGCTNPLYRRAIRVSVGTVFQIPWTFFESGADYTAQLHTLGFRTAALALRADAITIDAPALQREERLALLFGTEGDGLAADTIARCDYTVRIPMSHGVDSLNVAAASAVAFYQLTRRGE